MQKAFNEVMKRFSEIQSLYCELDNKISDFLQFLFNTDITVKADLSDDQINYIVESILLGGKKCAEDENVRFEDSADADIKGGQNA